MISLDKLRHAIEASWGADTSFDASEWTSGNPARGQCVVTSLVVQHYLSGELEKVTTTFDGHPESHYFNRLPDGTKVDLSCQQYPPDQMLAPSTINLHGFASAREKMMHEPDTKARYELLLARVDQRLTKV